MGERDGNAPGAYALPFPMDTPSLDAWIASELRARRKMRRLSQAQVAKQMQAFGYNWNQSTMTRIEAAQRPLSLNEIADLATVYRVGLPHLFTGVPERHLTCPTCGSEPASGFTCNTCGRSGA